MLRRNGPNGGETQGGRVTSKTVSNDFGVIRRRFWAGTERSAAELRRGALVVQRSGRNGLDRRCTVMG